MHLDTLDTRFLLKVFSLILVFSFSKSQNRECFSKIFYPQINGIRVRLPVPYAISFANNFWSDFVDNPY